MSTRRWTSRISTAVVIAQGAWIAVDLAAGDGRRAAIGVAVMLLTVWGTTWSIAAGVIVALVFGAPGYAALGGVALAARAFLWFAPAFLRRVGDEAALAAAVRSMPHEVQLHLPADTVTTVGLLRSAAAVGSVRWRGLLRSVDLDDERWDGPDLPEPDGRGATWSLAASEAAAMAHHMARRLDRPVDVDLLAVCATAIPGGVADTLAELPPSEVFTKITDAHEQQLIDVMRSFVAAPEGAGWGRRLDSHRWGVPRELAFERSFGTPVLLARLLDLVSGAAAVVTVGGEVVRDGWRNRGQRRAKRAAVRATPAPPSTPAPPRSPSPGRISTALQPWSGWPRGARIGWLLIRPAATALAVVASALTMAWPLALATSVVVLVVRPCRRWWVGVLLVVLVAPLSLVVAGLLAMRAVATEVAIQVLGRGVSGGRQRGVRAAGAERIGSARSAAFHAEAPAARLDLSVRSDEGADELDLLDLSVSHLGRVWATGDPARGPGALRDVWNLWRGRTALDRSPDGGLFSRYVAEGLARGTLRALAAAGAAAVAWLVVDPDADVTRFDLPARALASLAAAALVIAGTKRSPGWFVATIGGVVMLFAAGEDRVLVLATAIGLAVGVTYAGRRVERWLATGRPPPMTRSLGLRETGLADRGWWAAAKAADDEERWGVAIHLYRSTAARVHERRPALAGAALGRAASLELQRGEVQLALEAADGAADLIERARPRSRASALAVASVLEVRHRLGQEVLLSSLEAAIHRLPARWREVDRANLVYVEALSAADRPKDALDVLDRTARRTMARMDMVGAAEAELALGEALLAAGCTDLVRTRVLRALEAFDRSTLDEVMFPARQRIVLVSGRTKLLEGRLALKDGDPGRVLELVAQAIARLPDQGSSRDRSHALILKGRAHADLGAMGPALDAIEDGVETIERHRRAFLSGEARGAAADVGRPVLRMAFEVLDRAQAADRSRSAVIAARLVEAMHQHSLAGLAAAGDVVDQLGASPDLDALHHLFSEAYRPRAVDLPSLARRAGGAHVVSYYVPGDGLAPYAYCVWMPPSGPPTLHLVQLDDPAAAEVVAACGDRARRHLAFDVDLRDPEAAVWRSLGRALLPPSLLAKLAEVDVSSPNHVVIVTDRELAAMPWPALVMPDGRPLLDVAAIQLVPTLEMLERRPALAAGAREVLVVGGPEVHLEDDFGLLDITRADGLGRLVSARGESGLQGVYVGRHGEGAGADQEVGLPDGSAVTLLSALETSWPPWTFFGSCVVGGLEQRAGVEPLGLAVSCLLRGAESVFAGVLSIDPGATDAIGGRTLAALAADVHPAEALRGAQLILRRTLEAEDGLEAWINRWAGLVCISIAAPTTVTLSREALS
jgi:hypothetical protein